MAMTPQQLEVLLNNQTTQIGKIAKEQSDRFDTLSAKIKELQDLIDAGGTITPAIETAATAVQTALDELDASIPDAPPPTT
jgi:geranylgeranyl pyrophosphate synthase